MMPLTLWPVNGKFTGIAFSMPNNFSKLFFLKIMAFIFFNNINKLFTR